MAPANAPAVQTSERREPRTPPEPSYPLNLALASPPTSPSGYRSTSIGQPKSTSGEIGGASLVITPPSSADSTPSSGNSARLKAPAPREAEVAATDEATEVPEDFKISRVKNVWSVAGADGDLRSTDVEAKIEAPLDGLRLAEEELADTKLKAEGFWSELSVRRGPKCRLSRPPFCPRSQVWLRRRRGELAAQCGNPLLYALHLAATRRTRA